MFSAAPSRYPARSIRCQGVEPSGEECAKIPEAAISREWTLAARVSLPSTRSGAQPLRTRAALARVTTCAAIARLTRGFAVEPSGEVACTAAGGSEVLR